MQLSTYNLIHDLLEENFNQLTATVKHLNFQRSLEPWHRIIDMSNDDLDKELEEVEEIHSKMHLALIDLCENKPPF